MKIVQLGGIETIIKSMENFPNEPEIQENAILAFSSICEKKENRSSFVNLGGIPPIIKILTNFPNLYEVIINALLILVFVVSNPRVAKQIEEFQGIKAIIKTFQKFKEGEIITRLCALNLANFCAESEVNRIKIRDLNGIELIIEEMKKHQFSDNQEFCCLALFNLAGNSTNRIKITENGGVSLLLKALTNHGNSVNLNFYAIKALSRLSLYSEAKNQIQNLNVWRIVEERLTIFGTDPRIYSAGNELYTNLLIRDDFY
ncbi:protein aardvark [Anaeramoeba ignava]|uniref:Protein aardvark n=1 Tax=Anaeramoeba ignava TaxID=1746090 RepID=A0A9Q0LPH6_ANAIG|nr:protein aardvark [Anaeramoeba ignava]